MIHYLGIYLVVGIIFSLILMNWAIKDAKAEMGGESVHSLIVINTIIWPIMSCFIIYLLLSSDTKRDNINKFFSKNRDKNI